MHCTSSGRGLGIEKRMRKDEGNAERQKERKEVRKVGVDRTRIALAQAQCIACNFGNPDLLQLTSRRA